MMADVDEDVEFGSHFLDSMLEVEMTEEDGEVDIPKNEDPLGSNDAMLPPIPMFDLQSDALPYNDAYRNSLAQPVLSQLPIVAPNNGSLPMPIAKPGTICNVYSGFVPANATPAASVTVSRVNPVRVRKPPAAPPPTTTTPSPTSPPPPPPQSSGTNATPASKSSAKQLKPVIKNVQVKDVFIGGRFLQQVFKPEYVKHVFCKKESELELSVVGPEEMEYYRNCFKDLSDIQYCRLHCTICDKHLGCGSSVEKKITIHTMLKVLTCKSCHEFYGDGNFPCDQGDNCEIYCRWCGQGGALVCCSFCPRVFCKKCVRRNFGPVFLRSIQRVSDWACFCCAQKPLWPHRAICRALMEYVVNRKTDGKVHRDTTKCCVSFFGKKRSIEKPKSSPNILPAPIIQPKVSPISKNPLSVTTNRLILPAKTSPGKDQTMLKRHMQVSLNNQNKSSMNSVEIINKNLKTVQTVTGNNIIRGITRSTPNKILSSISHPQLIQAPVLHGETIITPPSSRMFVSLPKPISVSTPTSSYVRVSLTSSTPNLDLSKIPVAKIPHDVQGLILRLSFPDKVQLVRLVNDGSDCRSPKEFPMPKFKNLEKCSFIEENLAHSFNLSKLLYDNLMNIKEKVSSKTRSTEAEVFEASVQKLHFVFEKSMKLIKELDADLSEQYEEWKKKLKGSQEVICLSDDDTIKTRGDKIKSKMKNNSKFLDKFKELMPSDDSDIEILDDVSGNKSRESPQKTKDLNFKEKYRLRTGSVKTSEKPFGRKRRRVRKRASKRLKVSESAAEGKEEVENSEEKTDEGSKSQTNETDESKQESESKEESSGETNAEGSKNEGMEGELCEKVGEGKDVRENLEENEECSAGDVNKDVEEKMEEDAVDSEELGGGSGMGKTDHANKKSCNSDEMNCDGSEKMEEDGVESENHGELGGSSNKEEEDCSKKELSDSDEKTEKMEEDEEAEKVGDDENYRKLKGKGSEVEANAVENGLEDQGENSGGT